MPTTRNLDNDKLRRNLQLRRCGGGNPSGNKLIGGKVERSELNFSEPQFDKTGV